MTLGCGSQFAKFVLIFINTLLSLAAIVMIAAGIYTLVVVNTAQNNGDWFNVNFSVVQAAAGILIGVGCVIVLLCWLGCCGAYKEDTGCLTCYSVIVFILVILQIIAFVMAVVFYSVISSGLHQWMDQSVQYNYSVNTTAPATQTLDYIQKEFKCCGVESSSDWKTSTWKKLSGENVPTSCCVYDSDNTVPINSTLCQQFAYSNTTDGSNYVYYSGCLSKLETGTKPVMIWFVCIVLSVIFLQVIVGIMACGLKSGIKSSYEKV